MTLLAAGKISIETPPREIFNYWVAERWNILQRRLAGEDKPWSEDPIFQSIYFCNVRREDDKVTQFIRKWAQPLKDKELIPAYVLSRLINWPETLEEIDPRWCVYDLDKLRETLKSRRDRGVKVFGGAYLITTCGVKMDKLDYVVEVTTSSHGTSVEPFLSEQWDSLTNINGIGSFLAAQVVADLKNTRNSPWANAPDRQTFVATGPGSIRGMHWFLHGESKDSMPFPMFHDGLVEARDQLYRAHPDLPWICNQDLQNCFCEFSKYMRVLHGGGTKRKYQGC